MPTSLICYRSSINLCGRATSKGSRVLFLGRRGGGDLRLGGGGVLVGMFHE
jgi:hypothetical protein